MARVAGWTRPGRPAQRVRASWPRSTRPDSRAPGAAVGVELAGVAGAGPDEPEPDEPEPAEPEPPPVVLVGEPDEPEPGAAELTGDTAELTAEATGEAAEPTADVTGDVAEPTTDVTVEEAEPTVEARRRGGRLRRGQGRQRPCRRVRRPGEQQQNHEDSGSRERSLHRCESDATHYRLRHEQLHSTRTGPPAYPPATATNHARPDLLFGHHRTVLSPIGQGVRSPQTTQCSEDRQCDRALPPPGRPNQVVLYQERAWQKSHHPSARVPQGIECVLVTAVMGTNHSGQRGGERVNVLDVLRWQSDADIARYFYFMAVDTGIEFPLAGFETART